MKTRELLGKFWETLKGSRNLRVKVSHSSLITFSALSTILFLAFMIRLLPIRWGFELSEFDPYFQFHFAEHVVKHGSFSWVGWVDYQRWYPYGHKSGWSLPGLPLTAAVLYNMLTAFGFSVTLYDFCVLFPVILGTLTCLAIYFLGKDFGGTAVGLLSALFLALNPSYIGRTSLGFFDDETVGIFSIILFAYFFLRSIDGERASSSSFKYAIAAGLTLGYLCASWGAAFYSMGLTALFVFALIILRRYSQRLLLSYCIIFGLGLSLAANVPKLSTSYLSTWPVLPVLGVFLLLCLGQILRFVKSTTWKVIYTLGLFAVLIGGFLALSFLGYMGGVAGKFVSVLNPFERLAIPLIESVAEHRVTAWGSLYYDFGIGLFFFVVGLFFAVRNLTNRNLFLVIFGLTSLYFATSMVRLTLILAPALCVLWASGLVKLLKPFVTIIKQAPRVLPERRRQLGFVGKEFSWVAIFLVFLLLTFMFAFTPGEWPPRVFTHAYAPVTIMAGSLPIIPGDPVTEWVDALEWIRTNESVKVVCSWWDYGYWITMRANKTSLADNATTNSTQIQNIGYIFMSNEAEAVEMLEKYEATHILVFVTFEVQQGGDVGYGDEGKWRWMARIAGKSGRFDFRNESDFGYYNMTQGAWIWNQRGVETTFYKLMTHGKDQRVEIDPYDEFKPDYFKLVYPTDFTKLKAYGKIVPLVAIYKIDYDAYRAAHAD